MCNENSIELHVEICFLSFFFLLYHHHFITHLLSSDLSIEIFFKSHYWLLIHVFAQWIPSNLHLISMLYPILVLVQGHQSSSPVYLLLLQSNSKYLSYICHCFLLVKTLPSGSWCSCPIRFSFSSHLLYIRWPGTPAVVVSWLLQVYHLSHHHLNHNIFCQACPGCMESLGLAWSRHVGHNGKQDFTTGLVEQPL